MCWDDPDHGLQKYVRDAAFAETKIPYDKIDHKVRFPLHNRLVQERWAVESKDPEFVARVEEFREEQLRKPLTPDQRKGNIDKLPRTLASYAQAITKSTQWVGVIAIGGHYPKHDQGSTMM